MAFPVSRDADSLLPRGSFSTLRFTRRRDRRQRHNPNIDAAWWPRSASLNAELGHLLQVAHETGFRATGVAYRLDDGWTDPPGHIEFAAQKVKVSGYHNFAAQKVKVSGYHNHHRDMITLIDGTSHQRLQVLVVPPATPSTLARRALRLAAAHTDPMQGTDLLAIVRGEIRTEAVTG